MRNAECGPGFFRRGSHRPSGFQLVGHKAVHHILAEHRLAVAEGLPHKHQGHHGLAALLHAQGRKVGLYTSPHLVSYTERVEVDGEPVGEELFALGVSYALAAWERIAARDEDMRAQGVTEFELLTAAALVMYALEDVNYAVLEVGLGGRWDATSAVPTIGCVLTGVALDHTAILGDTLAKIAREKAAVIHPGIPVVLGPSAVSPAEVLEVVSERCEDTDVRPES